MHVLAIIAIVPAAGTLYFGVFWTWFAFWRRHPVLTYSLMLGTVGGVALAAALLRGPLLAYGVAMPLVAQVIGWLIIAVSFVLAIVADRQIGLRVRSFMPFFEERGRIELVTTGAYGIVRHPIYAAGSWYQLGIFLVTGYVAVAAAWAIFTLGALWFTAQEERRLVDLLADPRQYEAYRARVPRLFRWR